MASLDNQVRLVQQKEQTLLVQTVLDKFAQLRCEIQASIEAASSSPDSVQALDDIAKQIQLFEKYIGQHAASLPPFEVRHVQDSVTSIKTLFKEAQEKLQPKKKFGFKNKKTKAVDVPETYRNLSEVQTANLVKRLNVEDGSSVTISHKENTTCILRSGDIAQKDILIKNLSGCHVYIPGNPSTVHLADLTNCQVVCGPVSTSMFIDDCSNCVFVTACQQLRTHRTTKSDFYLHVTSKAIIEDCSSLRFAPFNLEYDQISKDYECSGLSRSVNNWDKVDDFNHLSSDSSSPNWSLLPEDQRSTFKMITDTEEK